MIERDEAKTPLDNVRSRVVRVAGRVWRRPAVRHIVAAVDRFNDRMGTQFAGSLTYFSFLALVPILMVAFSIVGFVLVSHPEVLLRLQSDVQNQLPKGLSDTVTGILDTAVNARLTVGLIGLVFALYSGISWMGNLRGAIQAMWRPDFDRNQEIRAENLLLYYWKSLQYLILLGIAVLVSLLLTSAGSWAQQLVVRWWGLDQVRWLAPVLTIGSLVLAVAADVLIFALLYQTLSPRHLKPRRRSLIVGAVAVSVAFEVLKLLFTVLLPLLLTSTTAKFFGQVIGLLFFFNFVATAVLFGAAWIATSPGQPSAGPSDPEPARPASPGTVGDPASGSVPVSTVAVPVVPPASRTPTGDPKGVDQHASSKPGRIEESSVPRPADDGGRPDPVLT